MIDLRLPIKMSRFCANEKTVFSLKLNNAFRACCQDRFRSFYFVIFQMWFVMLRHANIIKSRWSSAHFAQSAKTIRNFVTSASRKRRFTNRSRGRGHYALLGWDWREKISKIRLNVKNFCEISPILFVKIGSLKLLARTDH